MAKLQMKNKLLTRRNCLVAGTVLVGLAILSFVPVSKRVTAINLNGLYGATNIYEQSYGHQITAGEYGSQNVLGFYVFETPRGTMWVSCILRDSAKSLMRGSRQMGETSETIGDESYFQYEGIDPKLELAYRRFNAIVYFKDAPNKADPYYENTERRSASSVDADKKELEQMAKVLDDAILNGNANVTVEQVRANQVVGHFLSSFVGGLLWILYSVFHPNSHF